MAEPHDIPDLKDLIDAADAEMVKAFLWDQVKRNTALSLKLRAHLIENVESSKGTNNYSQVLGLLVHHDVQGTIRLTRRSIQILKDICEHFVALQSKFLHEGELRNAWDAGYAVISHLHLLMDKYHGPDQKLIGVLTECYSYLLELLKLFPAPELRDSIYTALWEMAIKRHHVVYDINNNSIVCLINSSSSSITEMAEISELILEKLTLSETAPDQNRKMWLMMLLKVPDDRIDIPMRIPPEDIYDIAHLLFAVNDEMALQRLLNNVDIPAGLSFTQQIQWAKWKFELALQSGNSNDIQSNGILLLKLDQDIRTYRKIKSALPAFLKSIEVADPDIYDELRGNILAEEQQWDALLFHIRHTHSLGLLIEHCENLLLGAFEAEKIIPDIVNEYALHYGGNQSIEPVAQLIERLHHLSETTLKHTISDMLQENFPGRFDAVLKIKGRKKKKPTVDIDELRDVI